MEILTHLFYNALINFTLFNIAVNVDKMIVTAIFSLLYFKFYL